MFPNKEVGDFMNKNFVTVKCELDKPGFSRLGQKYGVTGVPCAVVFDKKGEIMLKATPMPKTAKQFLYYLQEIVGEGKYHEYFQMHQNGASNKEFLRDFVIYIGAYNHIAPKSEQAQIARFNELVATEYFRSFNPKDAVNKEDFELITMFKKDKPGDEFAEYVCYHYDDYLKVVDKDKLDQFVKVYINASIGKVAWSGDEHYTIYVDMIKGCGKKAFGDDYMKFYELMKWSGKASFAASRKDVDGIIEYSEKMREAKAGFLEESYMDYLAPALIIKNSGSSCNLKTKHHKKLIELIKKSHEMSPSPMNLMMLGEHYIYIDKEKARQYLNTAKSQARGNAYVLKEINEKLKKLDKQ